MKSKDTTHSTKNTIKMYERQIETAMTNMDRISYDMRFATDDVRRLFIKRLNEKFYEKVAEP